MTRLSHLDRVDETYERMADEYPAIATAAAAAEAEHKSERARAVLRHKADTSEHMSQAEAETRAEADDRIAALYLDRLTKKAIADSHKAKLDQLKEQCANARTAVTTEREGERIHRTGAA